jgi:cellulose synthase/poly-beta-1,6-N-acetylglucosamine synthase-like glycosyltransferase
VRLNVIVTSFNEPDTIGKAVEQLICPNRDLWPYLKLLIVAPDELTLKVAEDVCQKYSFENFQLIKDSGAGKPVALNIAVETITKRGSVNLAGELLMLTDGDVYLENDAIKNLLKADTTGGIGGHPVSVDSRKTMFGYFSQLFCEAAHISRLAKHEGADSIPMSGYLYAIRAELLRDIFPLPAHIRAEDAYISQKILSLGHKVAYASDALVHVKFPKNLSDWYKQKTRSLGGNVQLADPAFFASSRRSIIQDLKMVFFPLLFAKSPKEFLWSLLLYPLRLFLWVKIYYNHAFKRYKSGAWERIESSK